MVVPLTRKILFLSISSLALFLSGNTANAAGNSGDDGQPQPPVDCECKLGTFRVGPGPNGPFCVFFCLRSGNPAESCVLQPAPDGGNLDGVWYPIYCFNPKTGKNEVIETPEPPKADPN